VFTTLEKKAKTDDPLPKKPEGALRFVCMSDTHGHHGEHAVPEGDVFLHTGDFSNVGEEEVIQSFVNFLQSLPHKHKIIIAGNHDTTLDLDFYKKHWRDYHDVQLNAKRIKRMVMSNCTYLEDSETTVEGIRIYGSPWQPEFGGWAFNLNRGKPLAKVWKQIPVGIDILLTHGPPKGHGGRTVYREDVGCADLAEAVMKIKPIVHVFGHIHEAYGVSNGENTTFINAANVNVNNPIVFDLK